LLASSSFVSLFLFLSLSPLATKTPPSFPSHLAPLQRVQQRLVHALDAGDDGLDSLDDLLGDCALPRERGEV
jgi:hypothetical protein